MLFLQIFSKYNFRNISAKVARTYLRAVPFKSVMGGKSGTDIKIAWRWGFQVT